MTIDFFIIFKGILIGIIISAPMGPIGVLCIQRTLNHGRAHGFVTGVGASFSDMIYALMAGLGVGALLNARSFVENNNLVIELIFSVFLLFFGYKTFRSNPSKSLHKQNPEDKNSRLWKDFASAFALNLTNIGILFALVAFFKYFDFIVADNYTQNLVGIFSFGIGTVIWWFFVSYLVDKFRKHFNLRGLKVFNQIIGCILVIIGFFFLYKVIGSYLSAVI